MSQRILIVEDDPSIVISLEFLMKKAGYAVEIARDGEEALNKIQGFGPDLILLDIMLPLRDGFEVCQSVRENPEWKDVKIVFLTAKGRDTDVTKGMAMGGDAYVMKPFGTRELVEKVREVLGND